MKALWFMSALAALQFAAAIQLVREKNVPLALVYALYGASNIVMIWVHRV